MKMHYAGLNNSLIFSNDGKIQPIIDRFTEVKFDGITDIEIGWNYLLLWRNDKLFISGRIEEIDSEKQRSIELPEKSEGCKQALAGKENIIVLSTTNNIWRYKIYEKCWNKVLNFVQANDDKEAEYPIKIFQGGCTVALTNLGRVYNIPTLVEMPKRVKFADIACGFDHTIMLADNGDLYSMGMGTRGQLGHGDLEDCDDPKIVQALAGLKIVGIAACGWHNAVITDQGDLYAWGWNTMGELGVADEDTMVFATPTVVDFKNEEGQTLDVIVKKVQCGNAFTICMLDDNSIWGCGSNKFGQLGQPRGSFPCSKVFAKLSIELDKTSIKDFKCDEWGSVLISV